MGAIVGIDLGTTFSAISVLDETGRPVIVHNAEGQNVTPSSVTEDDGIIIVGTEAIKAWYTGLRKNKDFAAVRFKRAMGTSQKFTIHGAEFTPTQLSGFVLKKLKEDAEKTIGPIAQAVVTVPANFSNKAREATLAAAKMAGLNIDFIINEPTAAALYYAFKAGESFHGNYAVYDFGGGTFDISIIRVDGQDVEVLTSNGIHKLGGDDFDRIMQDLVAKKYQEIKGEELKKPYELEKAEEEKKSLSTRKKCFIDLESAEIVITREEFEEAISSLITQAEMVCESTLEEAGLQPSDIKKVLLAGGSTRIPLVRESVKRVFGQEPEYSINVDEVVSLGAALYAAYKCDQSKLSSAQRKSLEKIRVTERANKCYGTIVLHRDGQRQDDSLVNDVLIKKNTSIPFSVTRTYYTIADGQTAVDTTVTESTQEESDPRFVEKVWNDKLDLPPGRPAGQEVQVTYTYDANQTMIGTFLDVASGRKKTAKVKVAVLEQTGEEDASIDKFIVE